MGTTEVATVTPRGVGLQEAVDRADPRARFAMAAVSVVTPSSRLLAVDASRMPAVMAWPRGISRATLATAARRLRPPTAPAVNLPNARLRLTADTTFTGGPETSLRNLDLNLWTFNPQVGATIVNLGFLRPGPWTYEADVAGSCPGG